MGKTMGQKALIALVMIGVFCCLVGCWSVEAIQCDSTPYLISEGGTTKQVYAIEVTETVKVFLWRSLNGDDWKEPMILWDSSHPSKLGLPTKIRDMPRWHSIDDVSFLTFAMGPPYPVFSNVHNASAPIRWIISTNPLVLAIGKDEDRYMPVWNHISDGRLRMFLTLSFVSEQ